MLRSEVLAMLVYSSQLIVFLWAAALVFSGLGTYYGLEGVGSSWPSLATVISGLVLLAFPRSLGAFKFSILSYLVAFAFQMPANSNHRWVLLFVALSAFVRIRSIRRIDDLAAEIGASLRWLTVVVYFFATLAKLNSAYFNPAISCASIFSLQTFSIYGVPIFSADSNVVALASVVVEALLPVLLIWPRSRCIAVLLGVLFHIFLSFNLVRYFGNFSCAMFVLLASWLPEQSSRRIVEIIRRRGVALFSVWLFALIGLLLAGFARYVSPSDYVILRHVLYLIFALGLLTLTALACYRVRGMNGVGSPVLLVLALAVINGLTPYLGVKTRSALTMYSNLRIEPGYSNHFFMPPGGDPFGYLSDTVEITRASDSRLQERIDTGATQMTYLSLCAYLACQDELCTKRESPDLIAYRRGQVFSQRHKVDSNYGDARTQLPADCPPWIARKLLLFGPVGPDSERLCIW
ncbi:MAG: hypothetical protein ACK5HO_11395 [Pseudomonadota bacterium]